MIRYAIGLLCIAAFSGGAGCSSDDGGEAGATSTSPSTTFVSDIAAPHMPRSAGAAVALADGSSWQLEVETCSLSAAEAADADPQATLLVNVEAEGTTGAGAAATLDIKRYRSEGASPTITDTVTLIEGPAAAPIRLLVAQRFEVDGLVTDVRDPEQTAPLLALTPSTATASGLFAPPGNFADDGGLVAGAVAVNCG